MMPKKYAVNKVKATATGNRATVQMQAEVMLMGSKMARSEKLSLRRINGKWKIATPAAATLQTTGVLQDEVNLLAHPEPYVRIFQRARAIAQKQAQARAHTKR
jgi:hypothetical protein